MSKITLSSIRQSVEAKFGSYEIELGENDVVELLHPIRLSDEAREAMLALSDRGEAKPEEEMTEEEKKADRKANIDRLVSIVNITAATPNQAAKLIEACSPRGYVDVAIIGEVVRGYMDGQKVGEASASQD